MEFLNYIDAYSKEFLINQREKESGTYIILGKDINKLQVALYLSKILNVKNIEILNDFTRENIKTSLEYYKNNLSFRSIIIDLDKLREESWNSLLKNLEEPNDMFFILISNGKIPTTIKSRSYLINISINFEKIEDKNLLNFFENNLEDYLLFRKDNLLLSNFEKLDVVSSVKNFNENNNIKNKSYLILSIIDLVKDLKTYKKLDLISLSEKLENILEENSLKIFINTFVDQYSKISTKNIEKILFIKSCLNRNIPTKIILLNLLLLSIEK